MINIFDISTLITDRTQADVQAWNDKGTYNPSDLNRVTHAMEYLVERIRSYGYAVNYEKVKVPHQPQKCESRLPDGYTQLEYIESSGTQHIDTGFKPNQDTKVVIDANWTTNDTSNNSALFGVRTSSSSKGYYWGWMATAACRSGYNASYYYEWRIDPTVRRSVIKDKNTTTVDGTSHSWDYATFQCDYNMSLFALNQANTIQWYAKARIYSCKIYDNGTLIRDYVPCKNSSGTVGLYDIVNGVFYDNAGTDAFTAGAEVELPPVEILDDYTWYHSDIPQARELTAYLQNVKWLRESMVLYPNTPEVPDDMQGFTFAEANDIEQILVNIETIINLMLSSIIYSGEIFSGEVI